MLSDRSAHVIYFADKYFKLPEILWLNLLHAINVNISRHYFLFMHESYIYCRLLNLIIFLTI